MDVAAQQSSHSKPYHFSPAVVFSDVCQKIAAKYVIKHITTMGRFMLRALCPEPFHAVGRFVLWAVLCRGPFCAVGRFVPWAVLCLGRFVPWTALSLAVLCLGPFWAWAVTWWAILSFGHFVMGCFVMGGFVMGGFVMGGFVMGGFVMGRFVMDRFVWAFPFYLFCLICLHFTPWTEIFPLFYDFSVFPCFSIPRWQIFPPQVTSAGIPPAGWEGFPICTPPSHLWIKILPNCK